MKSVLLAWLLFQAAITYGQEHDTNETGHDETNGTAGEHKALGLEAVLSGLFIHSPEHNETDQAMELHLTYWTTHKWAFGVGYSLVFEEEGRVGHEVAALVSHKPWTFLTVNAGPSFSLPNSHQDTEVSAYLETEWAFAIGEIHTGPTIGVLVGEDFRIFGGWHVSYEF